MRFDNFRGEKSLRFDSFLAILNYLFLPLLIVMYLKNVVKKIRDKKILSIVMRNKKIKNWLQFLGRKVRVLVKNRILRVKMCEIWEIMTALFTTRPTANSQFTKDLDK